MRFKNNTNSWIKHWIKQISNQLKILIIKKLVKTKRNEIKKRIKKNSKLIKKAKLLFKQQIK